MKIKKEKALISDKPTGKKHLSAVVSTVKKEKQPAVLVNTFTPANLIEIAEDKDVFSLIQAVRAGVHFNSFDKLTTEAPFTPAEWSRYLHLSERTMQRYKKEGGTFDPLQSEKIVEIMLLLQKGTAVFGDKTNFNTWLAATNVALGNVKPKDLLDSSFGINLLQEELIRIEYGVFA